MGTIYFVRHGQASFGSDNYDALSDLGHEQAMLVGRALHARGVRPAVVLSGSMRRHQETAVGALSGMDLAMPIQILPGVNEFDHENVISVAEPRYASKAVMMAEMAAEGDPRRAFQRFFSGAVARWVEGDHAEQYNEPWAVFKARCVQAVQDLVRITPHKGDVVVFTSGGTISVMCAHILGLPDTQAFTLNWTLVNTGITKLVSGKEGLHLISINEHAHLEGAERSLLTFR